MKVVARSVAFLFLPLAAGCATTTAPPAEAPATTAAAPSAPPPPAPVVPPKPPAEKPAAAAEKAPAKVAAAPKPAPKVTTPPSPRPSPRGEGVAAAPASITPSPRPSPRGGGEQLDLKGLEQRLKQTDAIGTFTKIALKNQVDDLLAKFRAYHDGRQPPTLSDLRQPYELLLMKVQSLLQKDDPALADDVARSRDTIWGVLADKNKFTSI